MQKITNLWKFWLNWSSKLQENNESKTPLLQTVLCFQIPKLKGFRSEVFCYYLSEKLPLPQKLLYFKGSCFSQCFLLSTALHCSLPWKETAVLWKETALCHTKHSCFWFSHREQKRKLRKLYEQISPVDSKMEVLKFIMSRNGSTSHQDPQIVLNRP